MTNKEMKIKVVTLANRLTPRMAGDKSAAFIKAWQIVKAGTIEIAVKGTSFGRRQEALRRLATYNPAQIKAVLVPEPNNPADKNTVAVMAGVQNGKGLYCLGYVPREQIAIVTAIGGQLPVLRVVSGTWGNCAKTTYGARVALAM